MDRRRLAVLFLGSIVGIAAIARGEEPRAIERLGEPATAGTERTATAPVPAALALHLARLAHLNDTGSIGPVDAGRETIRSAVAASAPMRAPPGSITTFGPRPIDRQERVDRAFQAAQIEGCFGNGALKFDPLPVVGDFVMGFLALPYTLKAMATGHCSFTKR